MNRAHPEPTKAGMIIHHCTVCGAPDAAHGYGWPVCKPDRFWCDEHKTLRQRAMEADRTGLAGDLFGRVAHG